MTIKSEISNQNESSLAIMRGAKIIAEAVGSTLGPTGKNVAITYRNERGEVGSIRLLRTRLYSRRDDTTSVFDGDKTLNECQMTKLEWKI